MRHLIVTDSDIIDTVGFDPAAGKVEIVFKTTPTQVYSYVGTDAEFVSLVTADSIGSQFHKVFKKRQFTKSEKPTLKK